nr:PREDICTED: alpha-tocopherol transfer protein-like isoform X2 [Bemisia tabaci]
MPHTTYPWLDTQKSREGVITCRTLAFEAIETHTILKRDDFVRHVLILCKNSVEKCKNVIDMYYTLRGAAPEYYENRDPLRPEIQQSLRTVLFLPLPKLTPDGYRVSIFKFFNTDPAVLDPLAFCKVCFMSTDIRLREDTCRGDIIVWDLGGGTMSHLTASLPQVKKFIYCASNASPMRQKSVFIINAPSFADTIINLAKSFAKKKVADRTQALSESKDLLKYIPMQVLPQEYGGTYEKTMNELRDEWAKKLESYRDWFMTEGSVKADESKRPGKSNLQQDLFGIEGSFRKINID